MEARAKSGILTATVEAVVIRADGTREDLGVVAYYHKNWWKRMAWRLGLISPKLGQE